SCKEIVHSQETFRQQAKNAGGSNQKQEERQQLSHGCWLVYSHWPRPSMEVLMATTNTKPELKARTFGENIESDLASRFLRVVETAAIASARTMGKGERHFSDQVATEAMRKTMDAIPMRGTIVIGEGERDEAPMLYIGEK